MAGIEIMLQKDCNIADIIPAEKWEIPDTDYSLFSDGQSARMYCCILARFLNSRYVVDKFRDHNKERRPWLAEGYSQHGREFWDYVCSENALKRGNFCQITAQYSSIVELMQEIYTGSQKERFGFFVGAIKNEHISLLFYNSLPTFMKINYVKKLKTKVAALLCFLGTKD